MDERIKKIADYYGYESQMDMLCEECGEFVQARNKLRRNVEGAYQNCLGEIADIAIMVEQMKLICGADRIEQIMNEKLDRQIQRIKDETDVIYQDDKVRAIKVTGWENDKKDEYISKHEVIDYLNGYLDSLGGGGAEALMFERGQRRALINAIHNISAIKAADVQPATKWISVKEQLPQIGRNVLIYYPKWDGDEIQVAKLDCDGITFDICGEFNIGTGVITHWMPLPEPPKDGEEE